MTDDDAAILSLVLQRSFEDNGYTVVLPDTDLFTGEGKFTTADQIDQAKKRLAQEFETPGFHASDLIDSLYKRNQKAVRLTVKSAPQRGYIFDYDHHYSKYFEKNGGGWKKLYKQNPKAHGMTTVSLPAHDVKSGLVLVYTGTQSHGLAGSGWIVLYKYQNGKLRELKRVMLYVSYR